MISFRSIAALSLAGVLLTFSLPASAFLGGFLWPDEAKDDIAKAKADAEARMNALYLKRDTFADYTGVDDPRRAKYFEYQERAQRYEKIAEGYEALRSNTTSNYYLSIFTNAVYWTAQDLAAIAGDMLNRWPDLVSAMIEDGWTSAVLEAYDSMFRILIRNKIRDRLGYDLCAGLERDLFAIVMPGEKRGQLARQADEIAKGAALAQAREGFAREAMSRAEGGLERKLKNMSPSAARGMTNDKAKTLVGGIVSNAAATVDVVGFMGDLGQKTYLYLEFSGSVDNELGALAAIKARCSKEGSPPLGCDDLMKVRNGQMTCEGAEVASSLTAASPLATAATQEPGELYPMVEMALAPGFVLEYCDFDTLEKDPEYLELHAAMSAAYERVKMGKRPTDEQLHVLFRIIERLLKRIMNGEGVYSGLQDEKWAMVTNAGNSISYTVLAWQAMPK